ncbi:MAG: hypothetical protein JW953_02980 [Anaerolineae bacterium]|nr:hypothetical protein [Anaerolineae bacterium]
MKKLSLKSTFSVLIILALLLTFSSLAFAQGGVRVYLEPVESTNDTLTVDVVLENVTDLYGAEFRVKYDPAVLAVQDLNAEQEGIQIETGTLLPADQGFVVANKVDEAEGQIIFAMTLLNPAPPVSGQGPLARVTFQVLQTSPSVVNVEHAKLVSSNLQTIPAETGSLNIGRESEAAAAPATADVPPAAGGSDFPWWIVAVVVMLLGVLLLGGLIVLGSGKSNKSSAPAQTRQPGQRPPVRPSGSRPSAFKQNS